MGNGATARDIQLSLLENALDFLVHGVEHWLADDQPISRRYKYGIHHVASAFELLLKERLRREHASLVFRDPMSPITVTWKQAVVRLDKWTNASLPSGLKSGLTHLYDERNNVQHYRVMIDSETAERRLREMVTLAMEFCYLELDVDVMDDMDQSDWRRLADFTEFHEKRKELIEPMATWRQYREVKNGGVDPTGVCPECWADTLLEDTGMGKHRCKVCGTVLNVTACEDYGERIFPDYEGPYDFFGMELCWGCYSIRKQKFDEE